MKWDKASAGKDVFIVADNVLSPLGKTTTENFIKLREGRSAVREHTEREISTQPFFASLFDKDAHFLTGDTNKYTRFERLLIASVENALQNCDISLADQKTILIISSTKGNISLLETEINDAALQKRISLPHSAKLVADHFGFVNQPVIVSNACISGVLAIITGARLLRSGQYENAVIAGADVITKFILSGFESFQALSAQLCKPFDRSRDGLNLGEAAGTIILSTNEKYKGNLKVKGGSVSNDANHISGPSRTGKELAHAINKAMEEAAVSANDIGLISAHGTATVFNDEMEGSAITLAGLKSVPLNSLKGYYGHTLGAAGLIESIISVKSLQEGLILPTAGFEQAAPDTAVNVIAKRLTIKANNFVKTASGFGGCNAALVIGR
ncbi:MAG: beta-ketoacyl synthase [Bacteroidota bacterium]|nr:beta-ketoacyl synthase [Bacteroidota bacterium]